MATVAEIQVVEEQLRNAMLASDVAELDRLISDQAIVSGTDGRLSNKAEDVAAHQTGLLRIHSMIPLETTIQLVGEVAIVFALMDLQATFQEQPVAGRFRYTRVWHATAGNWQIVAAHISLVPG